ncbi:MAG: phosphate acetyltransferase [Acidobacteriota bacterium]|nr:phosphate acetyltransferase [Acidobacteriota bacterium]
MEILDRLRRAARRCQATIVFPEGSDTRILRAATFLARQEIVRPILLGTLDHVRASADRARIRVPESIEIVDPATSDNRLQLNELLRASGCPGTEPDTTAAQAAQDPLLFGALLVRAGQADGCVAGAAHPTTRVLQAGLRVIGRAEASGLVSSVFLMVLPTGTTLTFADCAVVPAPDMKQLAIIATTSAETHRTLTGEVPIVAMLSFSTKGSAEHSRVRLVREATHEARQRAPGLIIDGELQFDAAHVEAVGQKKAPGSPVSGRANVFIFPNLDAGNIGYKLVERLAGARAIGPLIQGLAKPMHDLSRGCSVEDITTVAQICAVQACSARTDTATSEHP